MITELFTETEKAKEYLIAQGFDYYKGKWIRMDEGMEQIIWFEYPHKSCDDKKPTPNDKVARTWDARGMSWTRPEDRLPVILEHIFVTTGVRSEIKS